MKYIANSDFKSIKKGTSLEYDDINKNFTYYEDDFKFSVQEEFIKSNKEFFTRYEELNFSEVQQDNTKKRWKIELEVNCTKDELLELKKKIEQVIYL